LDILLAGWRFSGVPKIRSGTVPVTRQSHTVS
jgi:hypothetical protein